MKKLLFLAVFLMCLSCPGLALAWGPNAHAYITREAMELLPGQIPEASVPASAMTDIIAAYSTRKKLVGGSGLIFDHAHQSQPPGLSGEPVFGDIMSTLAQAKFPQDKPLAVGWTSHQIADNVAHDADRGFVQSIKMFPGLPMLDHGLIELAVDAYLFDRYPRLLEKEGKIFDPAIIHEASLICSNDGFSKFPYPDQKMINCPEAKDMYAFWLKYEMCHTMLLDLLKKRRPAAFDKLVDLGASAFDPNCENGVNKSIDLVSSKYDGTKTTLGKAIRDYLDKVVIAMADTSTLGLESSQYEKMVVGLVGELEWSGYDFDEPLASANAIIFDTALNTALGNQQTDEDLAWDRFMDLLLSPAANPPDLREAAAIAADFKPPEIKGLPGAIYTKDLPMRIDFNVIDETSGPDYSRTSCTIDSTPIALESCEDMVFMILPDSLNEGLHVLTVTAFDKAGNSTHVQSDVVIDMTPPRVEQLELNDKARRMDSAWHMILVGDEPVSLRWEITSLGQGRDINSSGSVSTFMVSHIIDLAVPKIDAPGAYTLELELFDQAGNATLLSEVLVKNNGQTRRNETDREF